MVKSSLVPVANHLGVRAALKRQSGTSVRSNLLRRFCKGKLNAKDVVDLDANLVDDGVYQDLDRFYKLAMQKDRSNASRNLWNAIWREHLMFEFCDTYQTLECGRKSAARDLKVHKYNIRLPHLL